MKDQMNTKREINQTPIQIKLSPNVLRQIDEKVDSGQFASRSDFGKQAIDFFLNIDVYKATVRDEMMKEITTGQTKDLIDKMVEDHVRKTMRDIVQIK